MVSNSAHKIFVGGLPNFMTEEQVVTVIVLIGIG